MNVLDLFSGVGGFSLGLERAGMRTIQFVEIDPFCRAVLAKHWPRVPCHDDIRTFHAPVGFADVICGGFPCQDISVAGRGAGLAGERSGLWSEYARLIGEVRPRYVIVENVAALLSRGLGAILGDLAALGYDAEWHCIPASAVGAPHRRDRIWIVAHPELSQGSERHDASLQWGRSEQTQQTRMGGCVVANAVRERLEGKRQAGTAARPADRSGKGRNSGWWGSEPDVGGASDGIPRKLDGIDGTADAEQTKAGAREVLRYLRDTDGAAALQWATRGLECVQAEEVLFSFLREYEAGGRLPREFVASTTTPEAIVRAMREPGGSARTSLRRGSLEQFFREHTNALRELSQLVASRGETPWASALWESAVPRIAKGVPSRVDRLRALGNAVVPQIPEIIGRAIMKVNAT